ncbi:MAG: ATP synthase F1 subunit epsilon [Patescibacteria group bacterium]
MKLILEIITPVKVVLKEEIDEITIPTINGEISILPNHIDLFTKITPGELIIKRNNKLEPFAIMGGFLEITNNHVNILADYAAHANDIEIAKVEEAKQRAEKAIKEKDKEINYEQLQDDIRRAALQLKIAKKHKSHPKIS